MKLYLKVLIGIVVIFVLLIVAGGIASLSTKTAKTTSPMITPHASSIPTAVPVVTTPYVEVDYQTVGWFFSTTTPNLEYNYTYLVLNVTITNHGYSQINTIGSYGFSVVINGNKYQALYSTPFPSILNASIINKVYDVYQQNYDFDSHFYYYFWNPLCDPSLPNPATLLDTGNITGLVFFQFGSPTVYPQPAQVLNEPFVLQYSVTYGNENFPPNAKVVINQTG
jgi:hypothetical protein